MTPAGTLIEPEGDFPQGEPEDEFEPEELEAAVSAGAGEEGEDDERPAAGGPRQRTGEMVGSP